MGVEEVFVEGSRKCRLNGEEGESGFNLNFDCVSAAPKRECE